MAASLTSAVNGVRSSCDTSPTKRRSRARDSSSWAIFSWSDAAMSLNATASAPNSSPPRSVSRTSRSPWAIRSAPREASRTGRSTVRAMKPATSAPSNATARPAQPRYAAQLAERQVDLGGGVLEVEVGADLGPPDPDQQRRAGLQLDELVPDLALGRPGRSARGRPGRRCRPGRATRRNGSPSPKSTYTPSLPRSTKRSSRPLAANCSRSATGGQHLGGGELGDVEPGAGHRVVDQLGAQGPLGEQVAEPADEQRR